MILTDEAFEKQLISIRNSDSSTTELDFSFIEFTLARLASLLDALETNTSTQSLNLGVTYLREQVGSVEVALPNAKQDMEFCEQIASHIASNHKLEQLNLKSNQISNAAVITVLNAMHLNCSIRVLDLRDNDLTDDIIPHIQRMLTANPIIELLNVSFNRFSEEGIQRLLAMTTQYCTITCRRTPTSPTLLSRTIKKSKIDVGFEYIFIDRNKPMTKQQAKQRLNMRERLKPLTGYEPDICEIIYAAYLRIQEINPGILTLFDVFKVIEQVHARNRNFPSSKVIIEFTTFCLQQENIERILIADILSAPRTNLRGHILHAIGSYCFATSGNILAMLEDPKYAHINQEEIHKLKYWRQVYLLIAYISFANIESTSEDIMFLKYIICRTIITGEHRFGIERNAEEITKYSKLGQAIFLQKFGSFKSMEEIEDSAIELPSILAQHKIQSCAREEILAMPPITHGARLRAF